MVSFNGPSVSIDVIAPFGSTCGGLNEIAKAKFGLLLAAAKLGAIFSGLSASSRTAYESSWFGMGAILFCSWHIDLVCTGDTWLG